MSVVQAEEIIRIAAKGDGVGDSGKHHPFAVPGDRVDAEGTITRGPHFVEAPCAHFSACGGCQLQHADEEMLSRFVRERVINAASGQGLEVSEELPAHLSPPRARRRATLHGLRTSKSAVIGFKQSGSHRLVDLNDCHILDPQLNALIAHLRKFASQFGPRGSFDVGLALCDQGVDCRLTHFSLEGLEATEAALDFARMIGLARLSIDQGFGPETVWEPEPVTVTLSGFPVGLPAGAFLQATRDAENQMVADAQEWLDDAGVIADLFAGLGTFAFALTKGGSDGRKILAAEADQAAYLALNGAANRSRGRVHAMHRDLFRNPLQASELNRFGGVLLDPPRAGAKAQVAEIAQSTLSRVVYVSCNPSSWARDAAVLREAGFELARLRPIGQFRWSTHVELTSLFVR